MYVQETVYVKSALIGLEMILESTWIFPQNYDYCDELQVRWNVRTATCFAWRVVAVFIVWVPRRSLRLMSYTNCRQTSQQSASDTGRRLRLSSDSAENCFSSPRYHPFINKLCLYFLCEPISEHGASPAIWDHILLPATVCRWMP